MRKQLIAAVAATFFGMGVSTTFASLSPIQAVSVAGPALAGSAAITDPQPGLELAGLVHAQQLGVNVSSQIGTLTSAIVTDGDTNGFLADEVYGLARSGQIGTTGSYTYDAQAFSSPTAVVQYFYNTHIGSTNTDIDSAADSVTNNTGISPGLTGTGLTSPDTKGIEDLSFHVLATNIVGATNSARWASDLATALGDLNTTTADTNDEGAVAGASNNTIAAVRALATGLWALRTANYAGTTGIDHIADPTNHVYEGLDTDGLKALLVAAITNDSFKQHLLGTGNDPMATGYTSNDAYGYTEDLAYGILALKAFNNPLDAGLITSLENELASAVNAGNGSVVLNVYEDVPSVSVEYAGATLEALPEPATLSLVGLGGLALLARRRRNA